jgi:putative tryptophan/tyrosine transport system substrate-binding protein
VSRYRLETRTQGVDARSRFRTIQFCCKDFPPLLWQPESAVQPTGRRQGWRKPDVRHESARAHHASWWRRGDVACRGVGMRVIGYLSAGSRDESAQNWFPDALRDLGWIAGKHVLYERRYAEDRLERLAEYAAELVRLNVDVIVAFGTIPSLAAKRATTTIPIVMAAAGDPVGSGLVASLARPGGNVTGMSTMAPALSGKRLELLKELLPRLDRVAVVWNAANSYSAIAFRETQIAAQILGIEVQSLEMRRPDDFNSAFEAARQRRPDALIAVEDPLTHTVRERIEEFAVSHRLPTLYGLREYVVAGGLMSYGTSFHDLYRRAAGYADKILRGANPADLPVQQPTKFDLIINLKAAKALGIDLPPAVLVRAVEVIE